MSTDSCGDNIHPSGICWFCRKGQHGDCMVEIPMESESDGPHDCTFDTKMVACKCRHA